MIKLTDSNKKDLGLFKTIDEVWRAIDKYLEGLDFKRYYTRVTTLEDGTLWIDYGSHTHFFYIKEGEGELNGT
jgi:hypothetical protein